MREAFPENEGLFQQDLAPCHASKKVKEFFKKQNVNVLESPRNSPDLNQIENLWSIVKYHLQNWTVQP